jgi:hypothetical protein
MSDRAVAQLTEAILERDQPRTTDLFFRMVAREGLSIGDALASVTKAEAPFVNVPCHINVKDGAISLINNDHTILGLRTSVQLAPFLPKEQRLLPLLQSVWYIPAGLDIWNQLLGKYPGRYATMKGMNVPPPSYGPTVWLQQQEPIVEEGSVEERLHQHMIATMTGDSRRAHGVFLGLAAEPAARAALRDHLLFLGLIDLQDTIIGRKARNTGHKALRARAVTDLAETIGWDQAHGVYYMGVPDMAVGPLYYSLYDAVCVLLAAEFPDHTGKAFVANSGRLTEQQVEELIALTMSGSQEELWASLTSHMRCGVSPRSLGDTLQIAACELVLRTTVPRQFTDAQHAFDYNNVANYWLRTTVSPYAARIPYLMANFINDVARSNKLQAPVPFAEVSGASLAALDEAIMAFDIPRATGTAWALVRGGVDVAAYQARVTLTACKFQDDPHNQKITHSSFEEYSHNSTHLRDRLLVSPVRLLAGWPKMPGERECFARWEREWSRG